MLLQGRLTRCPWGAQLVADGHAKAPFRSSAGLARFERTARGG